MTKLMGNCDHCHLPVVGEADLGACAPIDAQKWRDEGDPKWLRYVWHRDCVDASTNPAARSPEAERYGYS